MQGKGNKERKCNKWRWCQKFHFAVFNWSFSYLTWVDRIRNLRGVRQNGDFVVASKCCSNDYSTFHVVTWECLVKNGPFETACKETADEYTAVESRNMCWTRPVKTWYEILRRFRCNHKKYAPRFWKSKLPEESFIFSKTAVEVIFLEGKECYA